jgi:hypothetical protein
LNLHSISQLDTAHIATLLEHGKRSNVCSVQLGNTVEVQVLNGQAIALKDITVFLVPKLIIQPTAPLVEYVQAVTTVHQELLHQ